MDQEALFQKEEFRWQGKTDGSEERRSMWMLQEWKLELEKKTRMKWLPRQTQKMMGTLRSVEASEQPEWMWDWLGEVQAEIPTRREEGRRTMQKRRWTTSWWSSWIPCCWTNPEVRVVWNKTSSKWMQQWQHLKNVSTRTSHGVDHGCHGRFQHRSRMNFEWISDASPDEWVWKSRLKPWEFASRCCCSPFWDVPCRHRLLVLLFSAHLTSPLHLLSMIQQFLECHDSVSVRSVILTFIILLLLLLSFSRSFLLLCILFIFECHCQSLHNIFFVPITERLDLTEVSLELVLIFANL